MLRRRPQPQDSRFPFDCGVLKANVEGAPPQRIADPPLFIRRHDDKRLALGLDCTQLRNADLPIAQNLEKLRLELLADLVDLINQEHARRLMLESSQEWSFHEEVQGVQTAPKRCPAIADRGALHIEVEPL